MPRLVKRDRRGDELLVQRTYVPAHPCWCCQAPISRPLRVLVACEFSGVVRDAFRAYGHDAWSCDLLDSEGRSTFHVKGDVLDLLDQGWDLMIAHPPCTHLAVSGARWFKDKKSEQAEALEFVQQLMAAPIERIAIENPISIISSRIRKPDQIIQPWMFGHGETKATCLWLKNLPKLESTNVVEGREQRVHRMPPGPDRWRERSRTFTGIARAMAAQWGGIAGGKFCAPCRESHGNKQAPKDERWATTCPHARAAEAARAERIKAMPASKPLAISDSARDRVAAYEV